MSRILIASLLGGILIFGWGAVAHMLTPLGMAGLSALPSEEPVRAALKSEIPNEGMYYFPAPDPAKPNDMEAYNARVRSGPSGLLIYQPVGKPMMAKQLIIEVVSDIIAAYFAAILASMMAVSYGRRVAALTLLGVFTSVLIGVSYWNWYHFPAMFVLAELVTETVGMFLAALVIAKMVAPPAIRA